MKKLPEQVVRLGVVIGVIVALVLTVRFVILPTDMVTNRPHQARTEQREMQKPVHHAGMTACRECHEDIFETKYAGFHRNIGCENCHGPAADHAADPSAVKPPRPVQREFCYACHAFDPSRPNGFPQIDPAQHKPRKKCVLCHDPHDPVPPKAPSSCEGCHGVIVKTKATSSHALVECTTCHTVPEQHMTDPRSALPSKPENRESCGRCHAQGAPEAGESDAAEESALDAAAANAPKVDMSSHGRSYLCWDCHYPHAPEMKR